MKQQLQTCQDRKESGAQPPFADMIKSTAGVHKDPVSIARVCCRSCLKDGDDDDGDGDDDDGDGDGFDDGDDEPLNCSGCSQE